METPIYNDVKKTMCGGKTKTMPPKKWLGYVFSGAYHVKSLSLGKLRMPHYWIVYCISCFSRETIWI